MAVVLTTIVLMIPAEVRAGVITRSEAVPESQVINNDVFLTGENPNLQGTVNGDVFIVGSDVIIQGEVNGSVVVIAKTFTLSGEVTGNLYIATLELTQQEGSQIDRSIYALAGSVVTEPDSAIGRDLITLALSARLEGETERNTKAIIGPWEIYKIIRDYFNQNVVGFNPQPQNMTKTYSGDIPVSAGIPNLDLFSLFNNKDQSPLVEWLINALLAFVKFLIVGCLCLWIFPKKFQDWVNKLNNEPLASAGYGFLVSIIGNLLPAFVLFILIATLLGLLYLSLSSLAWMFFGAGMGLLTTLYCLFLLVTTFLSKTIIAYLAGSFLLSKIAPSVLKYRFLPLILGLLLYVPLASVPYFGVVLGLIVTLLGIGSIWLGSKDSIQQKK